MIKEFFKGVLWPREKITEGGKVNYKYIITGVLLTDKPLIIPDDFKNECVLEGYTFGLAMVVESIHKRVPKRTVGDAIDVLIGLDDI
ncbi:MAG: hypothetical protein WC942_07055 [Clostridia bacterium]|jgi:hypothetical protein